MDTDYRTSFEALKGALAWAVEHTPEAVKHADVGLVAVGQIDLRRMIALIQACADCEKRGEMPPQDIYHAYVALISARRPVEKCKACKGTGIYREAHEPYAVEELGCPECEGTGNVGGRK